MSIIRLVVGAVTTLFACGSELQAQQRVATVSLEDHRALARAAEICERRLGVPINYEDPDYEYMGDLEDVTDRVSSASFRAANPGHRVMAPRRSKLNLRLPYDVDDKGRARTPGAIVSKVIDAYGASDGAGKFMLRDERGSLTILPVQRKDNKGLLQPSSAIMNETITLAPGKRDGLATLGAFCDGLSGRLGHRVVLGTAPANLLARQVGELGQALSGSARDVLAQAFEGLRWNDNTSSSKPRLAWAMLFDPGMNAYFLNVRVVMVDVPAPTGGVIREPLSY
jgi:hypothetical protein